MTKYYIQEFTIRETRNNPAYTRATGAPFGTIEHPRQTQEESSKMALMFRTRKHLNDFVKSIVIPTQAQYGNTSNASRLSLPWNSGFYYIDSMGKSYTGNKEHISDPEDKDTHWGSWIGDYLPRYCGKETPLPHENVFQSLDAYDFYLGFKDATKYILPYCNICMKAYKKAYPSTWDRL